jgi:hypothetical protein
MKVTITPAAPPTSKPYPKLMIDTEDGDVFFMKTESRGTLIYSTRKGADVGIDGKWITSTFVDFEGSITLSN